MCTCFNFFKFLTLVFLIARLLQGRRNSTRCSVAAKDISVGSSFASAGYTLGSIPYSHTGMMLLHVLVFYCQVTYEWLLLGFIFNLQVLNIYLCVFDTGSVSHMLLFIYKKVIGY
jgi:hypothetical protein